MGTPHRVGSAGTATHESSGRRFILVDQDGPLADLEAAVIAAVFQASDGRWSLAPEQRRGLRIEDDYHAWFGADAARLVRETLSRVGLFRGLPPTKGGVAALRQLEADGHEVRICTGALPTNPTCASDKLGWVDEHLGPEWVERVIITRDKTWVRGDVLIDDWPRRPGAHLPVWTQVIFDTAYNRDLLGPRLLGWEQIQTALAAL